MIGLLGYLASWGHRNHLLCDPEGVLFQEARKKGIACFAATIRNELDLRIVPWLRRLIRAEKYDIVHFHTKRAHALAPWLGRNNGSPRFVVTRRMDYPVKNTWYTHYLYNRKVDGVVVLSEKIAAVLVEAGVRRVKIRVIYSGIDLALFQKARKAISDAGVPVIGTVAVLEKRKGHQFLLEAAALLKRQGLRCLYRFAGEGSERERLHAIAEQLGIGEDVIFEGFVADIPGFLSKIDVFVLPSLHEGLGIAALEAMAAGKPVVVTQVGGLPEVVGDDTAGLLVPPKDSITLARAISKLLLDKDMRQQMGARAQARIQQHFTIAEMARKNEAYYYELLEERAPRDLSGQEVFEIGS